MISDSFVKVLSVSYYTSCTRILNRNLFSTFFLCNNDLLLPSQFDINQRRSKTIFPRIKGPPRPPLPFKEMPKPHRYEYIIPTPKDNEYTAFPVKVKKLGGRSPTTGRKVVNRIGGGVRRNIRIIDFLHTAPENETIEEKVYSVRYNPFCSNLIALVAREGHKRWIVASENVKPGDIIKTINVIPDLPTEGKEGTIMPVGALLPGTLVHNVERFPGQGGYFARGAGTSCQILKRLGSNIVIKVPSGREVAIDEHCMAAVGRVSNPNHYTVNLCCPQRARWVGKRPWAGAKHKKDGYCGRKLHSPKPLKVYDAKLLKVKSKETQTLSIV